MILTGSDVEILLDLQLELDNTDPCEHSGHQRRKDRHSDDSGTWLVVTFCPCIGTETIILCGRFKEWCAERTDAVISCNDCGRTTTPSEAYQWVKKLGHGTRT